MSTNDQIILRKLQQLYSQENKLRLSLRAGVTPSPQLGQDILRYSRDEGTRDLILGSFNPKEYRISLKTKDHEGRSNRRQKERDSPLGPYKEGSRRPQRFQVSSVLGRKNMFKLSFADRYKIKQDKDDDLCSRILEDRHLAIRLALAHGLYLESRVEDWTRKKRLVLGSGNNSGLIRYLFQKKGVWKVEMLKKVLPNGQLLVQKDGQKLLRKPWEVDLLWTQECQVPFIGSLDTVFKPLIEGVGVRELAPRQADPPVPASVQILFSRDDLRFSQPFRAKPKCSQGDYCTFANEQAKRMSGVRYCVEGFSLHNHFRTGHVLGDKMRLLIALRQYCARGKAQLCQLVPDTYLVEGGNLCQIPDKENRDHWIYKPGEHSNRGNGIVYFQRLEDAKEHCRKHSGRSAVLQKYIENPMLYRGRKFDVRCYVLLSNLNNVLRGYWYEEGYVRTSSAEFTLSKTEKMIHLTNDAIQNRGENYGQFQKANKVSFKDIDQYLAPAFHFLAAIVPRFRTMAAIALRACLPALRANKCQHEFEVPFSPALWTRLHA